MKILAVIALALSLGACETLDINEIAGKASDILVGAKDGSVEAAAKALDGYCAGANLAGTGTRKKAVDAINEKATRGALRALDCNRDGEGDFQTELELSKRPAS